MEKKVSDALSVTAVKKDDIILVALESDGIFIDGEKSNESVLGNGAYSVRYDTAARVIAENLGIDAEPLDKYSFLQTDTVTGYNTVWNLKKPAVPVVGAGSTIAFKLGLDAMIDKEYVGEKNTEGFGKIRIYNFDKLPTVFDEKAIVPKEGKPIACKPLLENIIFDDFMDAAKENSLSISEIKINPSTLGRLTLMLVESRKNEDPGAAFVDFKRRIDSIKRSSERTEIVKFLAACLGKDKSFGMIEEPKAEELEINIDKIIGNGMARELYVKMQNIGMADADKVIKDNWVEYLTYILTYQRRRADK